MNRAYLLKVIDKHFWVLSKDEISEQIDQINLNLPGKLKELIKKQDSRLDDTENLYWNHPLFYDAFEAISCQIVTKTNKLQVSPIKLEKLFNEALLIISIYYHYEAVTQPNTMAAFLRLVLKEKILLA